MAKVKTVKTKVTVRLGWTTDPTDRNNWLLADFPDTAEAHEHAYNEVVRRAQTSGEKVYAHIIHATTIAFE